jgi:hypothetical protein
MFILTRVTLVLSLDTVQRPLRAAQHFEQSKDPGPHVGMLIPDGEVPDPDEADEDIRDCCKVVVRGVAEEQVRAEQTVMRAEKGPVDN